VSQKARSTFSSARQTEILQALVGLRRPRPALRAARPDGELMIEQTVDDVHCRAVGVAPQVKERPWCAT